MTRDVGQLTPTKTIVGLSIVGSVAYAIVAALSLLIDIREVELDAPAENVARTCDELTTAPQTPPQAVTSSDLIECPRFYDGHRVAYTGEAVRAVLIRGDRAWVQLNDDPYGLAIGPLPEHRTAVGGNSGIPVSIPAAVAADITYVGDHSHLGDVLEIEGVFRRADPADGGGPAITADRATITRVGRAIRRSIPRDRLAVAAALLATATAFSVLGGALPLRLSRWSPDTWLRR